MGVPVITLAGQGMAGRLTSSILNSAGCETWIAKDKSSYVVLAERLAAAGPRNRTKREQLSENPIVRTSDGERLCRELERIYREAYRARAIA